MAIGWKTVAQDNYSAASALFTQRRWRSAISRAYYAVYSLVGHALSAKGVTMPMGREGPSHKKVPVLVERNLLELRDVRWRVSKMVHDMYDYRLAADYKPSDDVGDADARKSLGLMRSVFVFMKEVVT
jgi:uncharacterized protein (UPF0332 family)